MIDTTQLTPTSSKRNLPWRDTALTFILLKADGCVTSAHKIDDKLCAVNSCDSGDRVLAVRQVRYPTRVEVMVIDNLDVAGPALLGSS